MQNRNMSAAAKTPPQQRAVTVHQTAIEKLNSPKMVEALRAVLPPGTSVDRYLTIAAAEIKGPNLKKVQDVDSIIISIFHAAKLGLSLNTHMGEAYLVPYNCKQPDGNYKVIAQFITGYQGLCKLVRQSEVNGVFVKDIKGFCVHENDQFDYSVDGDRGMNVSFKPNLTEKPGKRVAAFSMAVFSDGYISYHVVPGYKVEEIREKALKKTRGTGPWKDNEDEMWVKTPIRHHAKYLPKSEKLAMAFSQDEIFEGKPLSSEVPEELVNTGLVDIGDYEEIVDGNNASEADRSKKPDTASPQPKATVQALKKEVPVATNVVAPDEKVSQAKVAFLNKLMDLAISKKVENEIDQICFAEFGCISDEIPATDWRAVLDHFKNI